MIVLPLAAALALTQVPSGVIDEGVLVVRRDSQEVARETFHLRERRPGDPAGGWLLDAAARWPGPGSRTTTLTPVLELTADSAPAALGYDVVADGKSERITGQPGPGRFTLRYLLPGVERARELPSGPRIVIADDSVFSLFLLVAWHAPRGPAAGPTHVTAILPRMAGRATLTLTDLGIAATTVNRDPAMLRHVLIAGGPMGPVHVWLDRDGRLMKVEMPDRGLRAERLPG
jgi:hypothetical protein